MDFQVTDREQRTLNSLNADFTYVTDGDRYGSGEVWVVPVGEHVKGDCEDYALALLYRLLGRNLFLTVAYLLTGRARMLFYKHSTKGTGHAALCWCSEQDDEWVFADNISARWHLGGPLENYGYQFQHAYSRMAVAGKLLRGVLLRLKP